MAQEKSKQIFCWYGENDFEMRETVSRWVSVFEKKYSAINIVRHDVQNTTLAREEMVQSVKNALQVDSLFGGHKLLIFRNFLTATGEKNEVLHELISKALDDSAENFFLILWQQDKPDSRRKIFKKIKKLEKTGSVEIKEFGVPQGAALTQWIAQRAKQKNAAIDRAAVDSLLAYVGNNLWQLSTEIDKLSSYCHGQTITSTAVQQLVRARFNDDIFALMDALSQRDKRTTIRLMNDQLQTGASEMYLLAMLVRQFRLLRQVKEFTARGIRDNYAIAKSLKVHPFVVKKLLPQVNRFEAKELLVIYDRLIEFEFALKNRSTPFSVLFDTFIAKL